ncbi:hypothetical protein [Polaromonas sp.]|uniref:hypothetical protein n=1 Tax=Polaromonas sp. TaxID=1869339 RepID=UPI0032664EC8
MTQLLANNARALLTADILAADTSITIEVPKADSFPIANTGTDPVNTVSKNWFKAVLQKSTGEIEIIYVRSRAAGVSIFSNVIRGQEGTTALDFVAGSVTGLRLTALDQQNAIELAAMATTAGKGLLNAAAAADQLALLGASSTTTADLRVQTLAATQAVITGTATAIIATQTPPTSGVKQIDFVVVAGNGGAATTIAINGDAALPLKQYDSAGALVDPVLYAGQVVHAVNDGTRFILANPLPTASIAPTLASPPVPQTVLSGPVDSNGFAAFGGATGSATVTATGTIKATAAAGGDANYTGSIVNPSWTGLSTNGTMFLYLDITATGVVTTGSTALAPTYRWGGADVVTNLQNTFNIQAMTMKVGNGTTAAQVYRVFVGEVTVSGAVVTAITWYALMEQYYNEQATLAFSTAYSFNHNIGTPLLSVSRWYECKTADAGYAVGDRIYESSGDSNGTAANGGAFWTTAKTCGVTIGAGAGGFALLQISNKSTGALANLAVGSWKLGFLVKRAWS